MNASQNGLRKDGYKRLARKLLISSLAVITGCTNTAQTIDQGKLVAQLGGPSSHQPSSAVWVVPAEDKKQYDLPELGSAAIKKEPEEKAKDPLNELSGTYQAADKQSVANPNIKGYQGGNEFEGLALGALNSAATQTVKDWFSARHATAEISVNAGSKGGRSGNFDLLVPLHDAEKDLFFTQVGVRRSNTHTEDYRNTVNLGVGYRRTFDSWLLGTNAFYDRDMTGSNDRLGIGAEAFTDYAKFTANGYLRLSDWHKSPDLADYLERPSNGFDLRAEAFLPSYPKLGGKLIYEQYYGDQVGLFSAADRQKDPKALTVGATYNPVPMIGFGVDYRQGQGGISETSAKMTINYQFGVPLSKQLSLDGVISHKLANARYDLVSRNNEIVLDYKKAEHALLMLPPQISGTPTSVVSFPVTLTGGRIGSVTWTGTGSSFALPYNGSGSASVVLPPFSASGLNTYTLQAVSIDVYGEAVKSNLMQITVTPFLITVQRSKAEAKADGTDEVTFTTTLQEPSGAPRANTAITWNVTGPATITEQETTTNQLGRANLKLVSRASSTVRVSAQEPQGAKAQTDADFAGDPTTAKIVSLVATPGSILANGLSTSTLVADVVDANNNPLGANVPVQWATSGGALASSSTVTDENSKASVVLTSPKLIGTATVTATAVAGNAHTPVNFTSDIGNTRVLSLVATPATIPANGVATSALVATIEDVNGNLVGPGVPVQWLATDGTLSSSSTVTDASSRALVSLKSSTTAGTATVTAKGSAGEASTPVGFSADTTTAKVTSLVATPTSILANGIATSVLVATVKDANNNTVTAGVNVSWSTSTGTLSGASSVTDASGKATITLKGTTAAIATVTASAVAGNATATVDLLVDNSTAKITSLVATPTSIPANGTTTSVLVATVKDANNNTVTAGVNVSWSTSTGTLSGASSVTDASGKATITLKGTTAAIATVTASAVAGNASTTVTLLADTSTARITSLVATPTSIPANGTTTSVLVATVKDINDNTVGAGVNVTWSTSAGTLSGASSVTDATGKATITLKGTTAAIATVTASAVAGNATATVNLLPDSATAKVTSLVATPTSITANGIATSVLVATVKDANNNTVTAGVNVSWATSVGNLSGTTSTTDASGQAVITLSGTTAGTATVTATAVGGSANTTVTLVPDLATAAVVGVTATPASIAANGVSTSVLVATVKDAHNNLVGAGVSVAWSKTGGTLSSASTVTNASGQATVTLTSATAAVSVTVTASLPSGSASTPVAFVADTTTARVVSLVASPTSIVANGSNTSTLSATVFDANNNPVGAGVTVTWSASGGVLSASSSVTNASSVAVVTLRGTVAGVVSTSAAAVTGGAKFANVTLVADASTARVVSLTANPTSIATGGAASTLLATVRDANNNVLSGVGVTWATNLGAVSASSTATDVNGQTAISLVSGVTAGIATPVATAAAGALGVNVTFVSSTPVITSFSEPSGPISLNLDEVPAGHTSINQFIWTATNATRYELYLNPDASGGPGGLMYSGTANSFTWNNNFTYQGSGQVGGGGGLTFTLKAYNGAAVTSATIFVIVDQQSCGGGCSGGD
jgi:adhesin/invasin